MKKQFDLLKSYKEYKKSQRKLSKKTKRYILIFVLVLAVSGGAIAYLVNENIKMEAKISEQESFINDATNKEKVEEVSEKENYINVLSDLKGEVDTLQAIADTYPLFDAYLISILDKEGYDIKEISYNRGNLQLELTCQEVSQPSSYVRYLKETNLFSSVSYNGYTMEKEDYKFIVNCVVITPKE